MQSSKFSRVVVVMSFATAVLLSIRMRKVEHRFFMFSKHDHDFLHDIGIKLDG